jgi:tetratricopeptide (TPR) repeat protein
VESRNDNRFFWLICLVLALGSLAVYGPVVGYDFINYDDPIYVTENPHVHGRLTLFKAVWAFTTGHASNWHPLTWLSHMLDCQLYGLRPAGHHLTSVVFHIANTLLLFGVLRRMTGALWRSGLVAALFAWHPLHVESVAWIAERKDVLSAFFWLLTMGAYLRYVSESQVQSSRSKGWYFCALTLFALGLLSKPMVVTLPFVLLLLDYWPLRRVPGAEYQVSGAPTENLILGTWHSARPLRLVLEKAPFFILVAASSVVTFLAQKKGGAMSFQQMLTLPQRSANAVVSYARYLHKTIWPDGLAIFYPHPLSWPAWQVTGATVLLLAVTAAAVARRRRRPYLLVGWFWFLGTLVPVIGLVQVGSQSMADRYTYIPLIGMFVLLVWGFADVVQRWPRGSLVGRSLAAIALTACVVLTWFQVQTWRNSLTLFTHALKVTPENFISHENLGVALDSLGRTNEAISHFEKAMRLQPAAPYPFNSLGMIYARQGKTELARENFEAALRVAPGFPQAHYNMARLLVAEGHIEEAIRHYQECMRNDPDIPDAHYNLANALVSVGRLEEAASHYRECLRWQPDSADAHNNLGAVLVRLGALRDAVGQFNAALRIKPDFPEAQAQLAGALQKLGQIDAARIHYAEAVRLKPDFTHAHLKLGSLLAQQARFDEAKSHFSKVIQLEPTNDLAYYNLAAVFAAQGRFEDAAVTFAEAVRLKPEDADARARLAATLARSGKFAEAIGQYRAALGLKPDWAEALRALATILATNPAAELRNGAEAVQLAERANELTGHRDPRMLTALDEAYAEAGRFEDAIKTALQVQAVARSNQDSASAEQAARRVELYQAGKPFRE